MLDSFIGVNCLEEVYLKTGSLDPSTVAGACSSNLPDKDN